MHLRLSLWVQLVMDVKVHEMRSWWIGSALFNTARTFTGGLSYKSRQQTVLWVICCWWKENMVLWFCVFVFVPEDKKLELFYHILFPYPSASNSKLILFSKKILIKKKIPHGFCFVLTCNECMFVFYFNKTVCLEEWPLFQVRQLLFRFWVHIFWGVCKHYYLSY